MKRRTFLSTLLLTAVPAYAQFSIPGIDPLKRLQDKVTSPSTDDIQNAGKIVKGSTGIGAKEEAAIGGAVATEILATYGALIRDETITRRVNLIGKSLAAYCERSYLPFRFGVYDSGTPNAFSAPNGYVFISKGLYDFCKTDDQLAGVLAHEIIHVSRRHALRIISRNEFISGVAGVAVGSSTDFGAFDLGIDKISATLLKGGYDHGSEYEADKLGCLLAYVVGFQKDGLLTDLQGLSATGAESHGAFHTHPSLKNRIERLSPTGDEMTDDSSAGKKSTVSSRGH